MTGIVNACSYAELQCIYNDLIKKEPEITGLLQTIVEEVGGELIGLDKSIKSLDSIENKVHRLYEGGHYNVQNIKDSISDLIRYTYIVSEEDMPDIVNEFIEQLKYHDFLVLKIDNKFEKPKRNTHYKGLHLDCISPNGERIEIQIHTNKSYQIKTEMHKYYQLSRDNRCTKKQKRKALKIQRLAFDLIPVVPGLCFAEG